MLTYLLAGMTILSAALALALFGACGTIRKQRDALKWIQTTCDGYERMYEREMKRRREEEWN